MPKFASMCAGLVFGVASVAATAAMAQDTDIGKREFMNNCAVCHGTSGNGNGPLSGMLTQKVSDLTLLRKTNNGVFPFQKVYEVIDGRDMVKGHGTRDMPVWGQIYNEKAPDQVGPFGARGDYASFVRGRILALIGYIDSLQAK